MNSLTPAASPDGWRWLEAAIATGDVLLPGNDARAHVDYFVQDDQNGQMTRRLLIFTTDSRASVRRTTFELLSQLSCLTSGWPLVADAAELALSDADPVARKVAARLLVTTAEPDRAMSALHASTDPVVRIALVSTMPWRKIRQRQPTLERLRSDPVAAIRLLANTAMFSKDDPAAWPALDAAIRADLEACVGVLNGSGSATSETAGQRWAQAMTDIDREVDCCVWARRLANPAENPEVRLEGVRMAVTAMRGRRAAPGRLTPMLTGLLQEEPSEVRSAALRALAASLTASRLAADDLAAAMNDPQLGATAAIALGSIGDARAVPHLTRLLLTNSAEPRLAEAFTALARAGVDPDAAVSAARQALNALPDSSEPELPMRVLAAFGPGAAASVPELIARLRGAENDTPDWTFHVLERIGPAAAAALPELLQYPTSSVRLALLTITSDRTVADRHLAGLPEELHHGRIAHLPAVIRRTSALLTWLAEQGGLTVRQHRQLRSLFQISGFGEVEAARALWLHEGPAIADELLRTLPQHLTNQQHALTALRVLATMGPHAWPILDHLDRLIATPHRTRPDRGDSDAQLRADETLLAAMISAREQIAAQR